MTDKGLSVIVIERGEGVETTPIKTAYSAAAGTTLYVHSRSAISFTSNQSILIRDFLASPLTT
jgi:hypothetical protein